MICEPVPAAAVQLVPVCEALPGAVIGRRVKLVVAICPEPLGGIVLVEVVQLVRELHQRPEFAGFDPSSLHVWAYERYEPKLKDADAILRRFDYWLGVHKGEQYLMANGSRLFNKKELAEALGVARPTLDRLITNGWLEPCRIQISAGGDTLFAANAVREVLERFR